MIRDVRDYAQVYVNGALAGTLDRRLGQDSMPLSVPAGGRLDILVENTGRVNFAKPLRTEEKGITHSVTLAGAELTGWDVYPLPMASTPAPAFAAGQPNGPAFYRGTFQLAHTGDTFLDTRGWGKGTVWVNGHQLGRFWQIGPQQTLYVPGPWLKRGTNDVVVFDLVTPDPADPERPGPSDPERAAPRPPLDGPRGGPEAAVVQRSTSRPGTRLPSAAMNASRSGGEMSTQASGP